MVQNMAGGFGRIDTLADLRWAIRGMAVSQVLGAACSLGIADQLNVGQPRTIGELADACGADAGIVKRLVRLLAGLGVFSIDQHDVVTHTEVSVLLRRDSTPSVYGGIRFWTLPAIWRAWGAVSGGLGDAAIPFVAANGRSFFEHLAVSAPDRDVFHALMKGSFAGRHDAIAEAMTLTPDDIVVDIGGGEGLLLRAILARHPQVQGILFDLPDVVARAPDLLAAGGVADRCRVVAGDFFRSVPGGGTVYVLSWILHDWPDERAVDILRTIRQAMPHGARLVIVDRLLAADPKVCDPYDLLEDINMFVLFHGRERTEADFNVVLAQSGFGKLTAGTVRPTFVLLDVCPA